MLCRHIPSYQQKLFLSFALVFCVFFLITCTCTCILLFKSSRLRLASAGDGLIDHMLHASLDKFRKITAKIHRDKAPQPIYNDTRVIPFVKTLNKVHISVKSTKKYHLSRISILLLTWFQTVPPQNVSQQSVNHYILIIMISCFLLLIIQTT